MALCYIVITYFSSLGDGSGLDGFIEAISVIFGLIYAWLCGRKYFPKDILSTIKINNVELLLVRQLKRLLIGY